VESHKTFKNNVFTNHRMNKSIGISAIIPAYNREKTVARAIDSALAQEYPAAEIIVVDDGSKDSTREIVKSYGEKVRYYYQDNSGAAAARNKGVREAGYGWIAFLDSDDYWFPDYLRRMTDAMLATEEKAALYFSDIERHMERRVTSHWDLCKFRVDGRYELILDGSEWAMMARQPMLTPATVIRRENYIQIGGMLETLVTSEDTLLFYKLCFFFPVCAVSGYGAVATSSDRNEGGRLTAVYNNNTPTYYECSKLLYKDLLSQSDGISFEHRKSIKKRLVSAHLQACRVFLKEKHFSSATNNLAEAFNLNPLVSSGLVIQMLWAYCAKRLLPQERSEEN
jgi:glycosyltransferase involved in cell wall biosynthesis